MNDIPGSSESFYWRRLWHQAKALLPVYGGNSLEGYEMNIYGYFADILGRLLFQNSMPAAWAAQWCTFIARPIGGAIIGSLGDRLGRKIVLIVSIVGVTCSTGGQGLLPTFCSSGVVSTYCGATVGTIGLVGLFVLRFGLGTFCGGVMSSSAVLCFENADSRDLCFVTGCLELSFNFGGLLAALVSALVHAAFSLHSIEQWAWRIGFLLCFPCGSVFLSFRLGRVTEESDRSPSVSIEMTSTSVSISEDSSSECLRGASSSLVFVERESPTRMTPSRALGNTYTVIVLGIFIAMGRALFTFVGNGGFLATHVKKVRPDIFSDRIDLMVSLGAVCYMSLALPFALITDKWIGASRALLATYALGSIVYPLIFYNISFADERFVIVYVILAYVMAAPLASSSLVVIAELFPAESRCAGFGIVWNLAYVMGGFGPVAASAWRDQGMQWAPGIFIGGASLISAIAVGLLRKGHAQERFTCIHRRQMPW